MDGFWRRIGEGLARHPRLVAAVAVALTFVLGAGLFRLEFATGQDSYLDADSPIAIDNERYQDLFGGESMVAMFTMADGSSLIDLFSEPNLAAFEDIAGELGARDDMVSVITPVTALTWTQDLVLSGAATQILGRAIEREPDPQAAAARTADGAITLQRLAGAGEQSFDNPEWIRFLLFDNTGFEMVGGQLTAPPDDQLRIRTALLSFFPDPRHALLAAVVTGNASLDELADASDAVQLAVARHTFDAAEVVVTGTPTFLTDINDYLQRGMLTLGAIALVVMAVVLLIAFPVRWRLLPLLSVVIGVVWGFGLFGYLGIDLSLVTISGLPILIGIGVDFAIQVHNRVEEECALDRDPSPFAETMSRLGTPLVVATVAATIAFLTMRISQVPMIRDFGLLLALGIVAMLVTGVVIPLAVLGERERRRPTTGVAAGGVVTRSVRRLGSLPRATVPVLIGAAVALPVLGLWLERDTPIESDPINWADQSSDSIVDARLLEDEVGFATTLGVFIETSGSPENGIFTDEMAAFVHDTVRRSLDTEPSVVQASSRFSTVSFLLEVPGATPLPPTGADALAAYAVAPPDIQRLLVGPEGNTAQIQLRIGPSSLEERAALIERLERTMAQPGDDAALPSDARATPSGLARVGVGLLDNLTANRTALTVAALVMVAAWLLVRTRSAVDALLTMVPVLVAVGASTTLVSALGITVSPLTTVSGPLVVATCAEFSVLLTDRYREERRRGLDAGAASVVAAERTGRAFVASALTTIGGFGVLVFAALPLLRDFGVIVTLNVAIALLSALVVVPPLVMLADDRRVFPIAAVPVRSRTALGAGLGFATLALTGSLLIVSALDSEAEEAIPVTTVPAGPVATLATPTPVPAPAPPPPPTDGDGEDPATLPPGPPERPDGLVAGALYDALTGAGAEPGVARCAADQLLAVTPEAELLALGIASDPRPPEVDALIADAATSCGVPTEVLATLAGS